MGTHFFKQCPNGHWYQGEECPYCKEQSSPINGVAGNPVVFSSDMMKVCHKNHKYSLQHSHCPYCGDPRVEAYEETGTSAFHHPLTISFTHETVVIVDGIQLGKRSSVEVNYIEHRNRHRSGYCISFADNLLFLDCNSEISFGKTVFTGIEFIKSIDCFLDGLDTIIRPYKNWLRSPDGSIVVKDPEDSSQPTEFEDTKVCPHGHLYGRQLDCCPYCGEMGFVGYSVAPTLWPSSLAITFEEPITMSVDGARIEKVSCLAVFYNGRTRRSNYSVLGASVNYKSVIRIGGTVFTGKEFIKWVDLMINARTIDNHCGW